LAATLEREAETMTVLASVTSRAPAAGATQAVNTADTSTTSAQGLGAEDKDFTARPDCN